MVTIELDVSEALRGLETLLYIVEEALPEAMDATLQRAASEAISIAGEAAPVRTGALRDSIHILEQGEDYIIVGSNLEYAVYVEFGTSKMMAQPFIGVAADAMNSRLSEIFIEELRDRLPAS